MSKLTLKQSKWLKLYLDNGNATESAFQVYDCKNRDVARNIGSENLSKLSFSDFLEEAGVTDKLLQEKLMDGLNANKSFMEMEMPDMPTRHKYLETALKLKRKLSDQNVTNNETKILVMPSQLIEKYGISSKSSTSSE